MRTRWLPTFIILALLLSTLNASQGKGNRSGTMVYLYNRDLYRVNMTTGKINTFLDLSDLDLGGIGVGPNGEIAIASNSSAIGPNSKITIYKPDGSVQGVYRHKYMIESNVQFSADGSKLAYTASRFDENSNKRYSVQVSSREGEELYFYRQSSDPIWLPDGRLVYLSGGQLYLSNKDYRAPSQAIPNTKGASSPAVSPDGQRLVYAWAGDKAGFTHLYMTSLDGRERQQVTTSSAGREYGAVFSPNGQELLLSSRNACVGAGGLQIVTGASDVLHLIPADSSKRDIPVGVRARSVLKDGANETVCADTTASWR